MNRYYIALYGPSGRELVGKAYCRVSVEFEIVEDLVLVNRHEVSFPRATANWGRIVYAGIYRVPSGGTPIVKAKITSDQGIEPLDRASFRKGAIYITTRFDSLHLN
jgi:hypothetical protein